MTTFPMSWNDTVMRPVDDEGFPLLMPRWGYVLSAFVLFLIGFFGFFLNLMVILLMFKDRQVILAIFAIATLIQVMYINDCSTSSCKPFAWRNCYAYSVTGFIYTIFMIIANLWFLWGLSKKNPSVVLSWIVISSMWLAQVFCLLINLIYLHYYYSEDTTAGLLTLIFGLIAIAILLYGLFVIIGYWLELKQSKKSSVVLN